MARVSTKQSKSRSGKGWLLTYFLVIFAVLAAIRLVIYLNHKHDQNLMLKDLDQSGVVIDEIAEKLGRKFPKAELVRVKYCFESGRKFAKNPIFCNQQLVVKRINSKPSLAAVKSTLEDVLSSVEGLNFKQIASTKQIRYFSESVKGRDGCETSLLDEQKGAGFRIDIGCTLGEFDRLVYPELTSYKIIYD